MICRSQKLDYALVSSLERDPLLKERLRRLRTVPGVGPITALTWALEIGDYTRFTSIKQAISYCGLCGDEKSSADFPHWARQRLIHSMAIACNSR
jgi:transposase